MLDKVFEIIKNNLKNPKLYIGLFTLIVLFLLLFPYIDANYFYYNRVEKRIEILKDISNIEVNQIESNPILIAEYENILEEISKQKEGSLGSVFITKNNSEVERYKFLTGAALCWLVGILCLFIEMDKKWQRIIGLLFFLIVGGIMGYISMLLPTIINPAFNYVIMPLIQIILLVILVTDNKKV